MASYLALMKEVETKSLRKQRVFRDRLQILDTVGDDELVSNYRMCRESLFEIIDMISPSLERETRRSHALTPEIQVLVTLRYFSKGGFFSEIGQLHSVSVPSVSRIILRTTEAICTSLDNIKFPLAACDQRTVKESFHNIAGFPRVLGCIDGTLIPIQGPSGNEEPAYVCRKGFHAINAQAVCDSNLRFLNVVSRWPGSTHDATVLSNSSLGQYLENNPQDGWLLGDSGYACHPWLITPILELQTRAEEKFNSSHCRTRNTVERAFGVLKSRFRCLHKSTGCLPFTPGKCSRVIMACFKLHNFCISKNMPNFVDNDIEDHDDHVDLTVGVANDGQTVRKQIIAERFT